MKTYLSLLLLAGLSSVASASPYVVYTGEAVNTDFSAAGAVKATTYLYLVTDVADTSSFAILQVDAASKVYSVVSRPSDSPTTEETNNNFLGGIMASSGKNGMGVLSFSSSTADSSSNTFISHAYATGPLTLKPVALVAARTKPLVVALKTNGVVTGTYTFSTLSPLMTTGAASIPTGLSGTSFKYEIGSAGPLTTASMAGAMVLSENSTLTALANIGGGYIVGRNTSAVLPLTIPSGTTAADAYAAWLGSFAAVNGFTQPVTIDASGSSSSDSSSFSGSTLALSSGGASVSKTSGGTFVFDGSSGASVTLAVGSTLQLYSNQNQVGVVTATNNANSANNFSNILSVGGVLSTTSWTSTGISVTQTDPAVPGASLVLNNYSGGVIISNGTGGFSANGAGTLTLTNTSTNLLGSGHTLVLTGSTITVTAVNNGLVDGTLTSAGITSFNFTGATMLVNGANSGTTLNPGDVVTGSASVNAGTLTIANGIYTDAGSTFTVTTP